MFGAIRTGTSLPGCWREMLICRVAALTNAAFEWDQHYPIAVQEGVTVDKMAAVRDTTFPHPSRRRPSPLSEVEELLMALTDQLTIDCSVDEGTWAALEDSLDPERASVDQQMTEIVSTISGYNSELDRVCAPVSFRGSGRSLPARHERRRPSRHPRAAAHVTLDEP
jgi:alkylhydroperoxidase family enzyme